MNLHGAKVLTYLRVKLKRLNNPKKLPHQERN